MGSYFGSKATSGLCQAIIALMPPHDTSNRRHRFDDGAQDHIALLEPLKGLPCHVILSGYPSALHGDETSLRAGRSNYRIHVHSSGGDHAEAPPPQARGAGEAVRAINIIPRHGGSIIHDCWASYLA
jgi:hypothetical protein